MDLLDRLLFLDALCGKSDLLASRVIKKIALYTARVQSLFLEELLVSCHAAFLDTIKLLIGVIHIDHQLLCQAGVLRLGED